MLRVGGWIQTFTGRAVYPMDPMIDEIDIEDIAHSLSMQCRYTGHTKKFYSVAEHSVYISYFVKPENALWGLLHDASEAYLTDIPRPVKPYLPEYKKAELQMMRVIAAKFGLDWPEPAEVKEMDTRILFNERRDLLHTSILDWNLSGEPIPGLTCEGWQPAKAKRVFLRRFKELTT
jgi:uncharacterized protein